MSRCNAATSTGAPCQFQAMLGRELCATHAAQRGDAEASAILRARNETRCRMAVETRRVRAKQRNRVPIGTVAEIKDHVSQLLALLEGDHRGNKTQRARAGAALVQQALDLLKSDIERQSREIADIIDSASPEIRARLLKVVG